MLVKDPDDTKKPLTESQESEKDALVKKGDEMSEQGKYEEAIRCYDRALEIDPDDYIILVYGHGSALEKMGRFDKVIECLDRALEMKPSHPYEFYFHKGRILFKLDRFTEAMKCFDRALEISPDYYQAYNNKGQIFYRHKKFTEAIECFDRALEISPNNHGLHNDRGLALYRLGKLTKAMECYDRALEIKPDYPLGHNNRGEVFYKQEKFTEAIECYDRALEIEPNFGYALVNKENAQARMRILSEDVPLLSEKKLKIICPVCKTITTFRQLADCEINRDNPEDIDLLNFLDKTVNVEMTRRSYGEFKTLAEGARKVVPMIAHMERHKKGLLKGECSVSNKVYKVFFCFYFDHKRRKAGYTFCIGHEIPMD